MDAIQRAVRKRYAAAAARMQTRGGCCGSASDPDQELTPLGLDAAQSMSCGKPTVLAQLRPGETVLDLGSGAGLDVLLSARRVSPGGHAYGVDMTNEMLALANRNKAKAGVENATFLEGTIEAIPLPDASLDVVISNCVTNLAADKGAVLREAFRVLKPGGRLAVSDMVEVEPLPGPIKASLDAWAGCIAGTIPVTDYRRALLDAGFAEPSIEIIQTFGLPAVAGEIASAYVRALKPL